MKTLKTVKTNLELRAILIAAACPLSLTIALACGGDAKSDKGDAKGGDKAPAGDPCKLLEACAAEFADAKPMLEAAMKNKDTAADTCTQTMNGLYMNPSAPESCKTLPKERR